MELDARDRQIEQLQAEVRAKDEQLERKDAQQQNQLQDLLKEIEVSVTIFFKGP